MYLISLNCRFSIVGIRTRERKSATPLKQWGTWSFSFVCDPLQTELNSKSFWEGGKKDFVNCKTWHRESRAHTLQNTALQCSVKTNKAIFKETLNKKGSSNKNGRVPGQEQNQLLTEEPAWFITPHWNSENSQSPAAQPMQECSPWERKNPKFCLSQSLKEWA